MSDSSFDYTLSDSQATPVEPLSPRAFDFSAWGKYEASCRERCRGFWESDSGVLVHRRMRVAEVFAGGCRSPEQSLARQIGALRTSMAYKADVLNFLEPWYGIGTIASCYGAEYRWEGCRAPAVQPALGSVGEALAREPVPAAETPIGRHTLKMIRYFLDETRGLLPLSLTDTQAPLNMAGHVVGLNSLLTELMLNEEAVRSFLMRLAGLLDDFNAVQRDMLGDTVVWPGHGFASSREFAGLGMSNDTAAMISPESYESCVAPADCAAAKRWGGPVFHSCGNWEHLIDAVARVPGLRMVDAAFSHRTDPSPNTGEPFRKGFAGTGVVVNARIVGSRETVMEHVKQLWAPGMKLIVVTYCETPEEQAAVYEDIHAWCT